MSHKDLATYLNNHLAGSIVACDHLERLQKTYAGTPLEHFFSDLYNDIEADHQELKALMKQLDISVSRTRKTSAWFSEKVTEIKLRLDDPSVGELRRLESLEALAVGIEGKKVLWHSLITASKTETKLRVANYDRLEKRAQNQRKRVEKKRLAAAQKALTSL